MVMKGEVLRPDRRARHQRISSRRDAKADTTRLPPSSDMEEPSEDFAREEVERTEEASERSENEA